MVTDTYDVVLLGFDDGQRSEAPAEALRRLFQIDADTARQLVAEAPVTVKRGVSEEVARIYLDGLRSIGARVELRPSAAPVSRRPAPAEETPIAPGAPTADDERPPGFYASLPSAFVTPLRGPGLVWMATVVGLVGVAVVGAMAPIVGCLVYVVVAPAVLTVIAKYFQACMAATAMGVDRPQGFPELSGFMAELVLPGLALCLWFVVANVPLLLWVTRAPGGWEGGAGLVSNPITLALVALPYVLWPAALARGAATGSWFSMFNIPRLVVGIARAPLPYLVVLAVGAAGAVAPGLIDSLRSQACGALLRNLAVTVLELAIFAYAHGAMGAAMGHLARVAPAFVDEGA
jgi:hypothetical protein